MRFQSNFAIADTMYRIWSESVKIWERFEFSYINTHPGYIFWYMYACIDKSTFAAINRDWVYNIDVTKGRMFNTAETACSWSDLKKLAYFTLSVLWYILYFDWQTIKRLPL